MVVSVRLSAEGEGCELCPMGWRLRGTEGEWEGGEEPLTLASGPSGLHSWGWHGFVCRRGRFRSGRRLRGFLQPSRSMPPYLGRCLVAGGGGATSCCQCKAAVGWRQFRGAVVWGESSEVVSPYPQREDGLGSALAWDPEANSHPQEMPRSRLKVS